MQLGGQAEARVEAMCRNCAVGLVGVWLWATLSVADPVVPNKPATPPPGGSSIQRSSEASQSHGRSYHHHDDIFYYDRCWPFYPPFYGYYPAPLYLPAETLFGPQAVRRFMGLADGSSGSASFATGASLPIVSSPQVQEKPEKKAVEPVPRGANPDTRGLAWRFITFGDLHFSNEKFGEAYQRYRKAAEIVPELADAYFRQGFALVGAGRYEMAAKALKRGIALDPGWSRSAFRLGDLYGGNQRAKAAHLEALAVATEKDANNADLMFLLGVCLYFDGQRDRATLFFERAKQLAGPADHLKGFLEPVAKR